MQFFSHLSDFVLRFGQVTELLRFQYIGCSGNSLVELQLLTSE
jgi:hypothetical protein